MVYHKDGKPVFEGWVIYYGKVRHPEIYGTEEIAVEAAEGTCSMLIKEGIPTPVCSIQYVKDAVDIEDFRKELSQYVNFEDIPT